ncbi:MAG: MerR family transcriptional regulator [Actinomycetia bacterium]|jgi:transposase-like protein|nr:MerR family transcriptional regulator [Actinomycetes bacterium]
MPARPSPAPAEPPGVTGGPALSAALTVAAVARRLGVAPATLRTWDRRYGIGPSLRTAGAHRRYGPEDVARLEVMRRLTLDGVGPGEAARVALASDGSAAPAASAAHAHGGGRVLALPQAAPDVRGLGRAAMALDGQAVLELLRSAVAARGVVPTWEELVVPVLAGIGRRWESTGQSIEVEHLLSECVATVLRAVGQDVPAARNHRPVLLAAAAEEMHTLPLYAVAGGLAEVGVQSRLLGARVPGEALAAAVRRSGPSAVFVWSQLSATGDPGLLAGLPGQRSPVLVAAGGPGWPEVLPDGVVRCAHLEDAVARLAAAAGG